MHVRNNTSKQHPKRRQTSYAFEKIKNKNINNRKSKITHS